VLCNPSPIETKPSTTKRGEVVYLPFSKWLSFLCYPLIDYGIAALLVKMANSEKIKIELFDQDILLKRNFA